MLIYEVKLEIDPQIFEAFCRWLKQHVAEILSLPGFLEAEIWQDQQNTTLGWCILSIQYRLKSQADLDHYLQENASKMRAEGQKLFANQFRAERRVLNKLDHLKS